MSGHLTRKASYVLLGYTTLLSVAATLDAQQASLALRSRRIVFTSETTDEFIRRVRSSTDGMHGYAQLRKPPTANDRRALAARGVSLLSRLARYGYIVRVQPTAITDDTAVTTRIAAFASAEPADKVNPAIWGGQFSGFALRLDSLRPLNLVLNADSTLTVVVQFHDDVSPARADSVLATLSSKRAAASRTRWAVVTTRAAIRELAAQDIVRWIDAPRPPAVSDLHLVRDQIRVSEIQGFDGAVATGLTGDGITIGVYDGGIDKANPDFKKADGSSRIIHEQSPSWHGTAVAGIIAGNGKNSSGADNKGKPNGGTTALWRGIAPSATMIDSKDIFGDDAQNAAGLLEHIKGHGMDLSNHSYSLAFDGEYDAMSKFHDDLIRGDAQSAGIAIPGRLHVHSAGNLGRSPVVGFDQFGNPIKAGNQRGYFSLGQQLKNALVVGNYYYDAKRAAGGASLGPAYDGRIKPDVVAPGTWIKTAGWCDTPNENPAYSDPGSTVEKNPCDGVATPPRTNFYFTPQGSSLAAAATTGMLALVLQEMVKWGANLDASAPWPSTLRAIAIHSASDVDNAVVEPNTELLSIKTFPGPDFTTGFGLIDAAAAVEVVRSLRITQGVIEATCTTKSYKLHVPASAGPTIKVTLAWDDSASDAAETARVQPLLINDLDLVLVDPTGAKHYPWLLDQQAMNAEGTAAVANEAQTCGVPLTVRRRIMPAEEPKWFADVHPSNVDDNFTDADLLPAGKGKDHLNNVEQVEAASIPGTWKVEVSGFMIEGGPQRFSLIGVPPRGVFSYVPTTLCQRVQWLCNLKIRTFCSGKPELCAAPQLIQTRNNSLAINFRAQNEPKIISLSSLCFAVSESETCDRSPGREVRLGPGMGAFRVELYAADGKLLARDVSSRGTKRVRVPDGTGERFLVIEPRAPVRLMSNYDIPILIRQ